VYLHIAVRLVHTAVTAATHAVTNDDQTGMIPRTSARVSSMYNMYIYIYIYMHIYTYIYIYIYNMSETCGKLTVSFYNGESFGYIKLVIGYCTPTET
jgi:hypothetical protein